MTPNTQAISKDHAPLTVHECEQFLVHEAALLDEARFDDWLDLFTEDARYWVPSEPNQASPYDTVSLIYDDRRLLETRVRRLASPQIYSQEPRSRTSRIVTNVGIASVDSVGTYLVRSKFLLIEYRREQQRLFGGTYLHSLVADGDSIKIKMKRVNLVNCDAPMDGLVIPF
jgi:3-phenylpropionate/cinnamic acid dioxygenase small subunit